MTVERILTFAFGLLATIAAALLIADAMAAPVVQPAEERRRRERATRSRPGEALLGLGLTGIAVALFGTDRWPWGVVAVLAGLACLIVGTWLNRRLLIESIRHRGPARRRH
jgi:energy-converting hydrogenase Eha subunit A